MASPFVNKTPDEIILSILDYTTRSGKYNLMRTCRRFYNITEPELFKHDAVSRDYRAVLYACGSGSVPLLTKALNYGAPADALIHFDTPNELYPALSLYEADGTGGVNPFRILDVAICSSGTSAHGIEMVSAVLAAGADANPLPRRHPRVPVVTWGTHGYYHLDRPYRHQLPLLEALCHSVPVEVVRLLLDAGADPTLRQSQPLPSMLTSRFRIHINTILDYNMDSEVLVQKFALIMGRAGREYRSWCAVQLLRTPICPMSNQQIRYLEVLIALGIDANYDETPVGIVPQGVHTALATAFFSYFQCWRAHGTHNHRSFERTVRLLLEAGADPNASVLFSWSTRLTENVFHVACKIRNGDLVPLFLRHGANPNLPNREGMNALRIMCDHLSHRADLIEALLTSGALPNVKDDLAGKRYTPLHILVKNKRSDGFWMRIVDDGARA
ncbi:hypothetical protein GGR56DRAFT_671824 [Xylariaceae sp. FL0804]|nr:hypothetical protein GGR56DRAFT_671824 [Xylariaceae sp. FL0804]